VYDGPNACHWPVEKIAAEVDAYIKVMQEAIPGVIIGDTEPLTGAADAAAYKGWLETFRAVNGYDLAFLHMDVDWSRPGWPQEIKSMTEYGEQAGLPMGMMYFGNGVDRTDEGWISAAGERVKKLELEAGASPQHVLFQSWNDKPDFVRPSPGVYMDQFHQRLLRGQVGAGIPARRRRREPGVGQARACVTAVRGSGRPAGRGWRPRNALELG
jgi:hypothetical protein